MGTMANNVLSDAEVQSLMTSVLEEENVIGAKMKISSGAAKGDGYMSFLTKVDVTGENKNLHCMIKCAPKTEEFRKLAPIRKCYLREIYMYDVIFPAFRKFQEERNVERPFACLAKCFKTHDEEWSECLILENIKERGFRLWDRREYMNDEHITMVFKHYGKLHALSHAMQVQNKELFHNLTKDLDEIFSKDTINPEVFGLFASAGDKMLSLFCPETEPVLYNAVSKFNEGIMGFFQFLEDTPGDYAVICHGDCWCNNMMFKYDDESNPEKPTDLCLLDFQISKVGSPVIDLSYFFYVSSPKHILDKLDHYLEVYHQSYTDHMKALGSDAEKKFPFSALKQEWRIFSKFGLIMALMVVKAMLRENDEIVDFSDLTQGTAIMNDFLTKECKNDVMVNHRFRNLAVHLQENGFI